MNGLMYFLIFTVLFLVDFFPSGLKLMPRPVGYTVDLLALVICVLMGLRLVGRGRTAIAPKYLGLVILYLIALVTSVILNWTRVEPFIVGMRFHLKYLPFFLLPMVFEFSDQEIRKQLRFILTLLLLQFPIVMLQKFVFLRHAHADFMTGTLGVSSHLSMVLICAIAIAFAFHLRGELSLKRFLGTTLWLFGAAVLNETKSTLVLFPMALALPAFFLPRVWASAKIKNLFTVGVVVLLLGTIFATTFQAIEGYSVIEHYEKEAEGQGYLYTGSQGGVAEKEIGRVDAILLALKDLSKDGYGLFFGLGAGNVISVGPRSFRGDYAAAKVRYRGEALTLTHQLWELGLAGVVIYMAFLLFIFWDALFLTKSSGVFGVLGLGFTAVSAIVSISIIYKNIMFFNALYVLFWYFSGVIAARAHKLRGLANAISDLKSSYVGLGHLGSAEAVIRPASWKSSRGRMDSERRAGGGE
jgi:hypothetical protein